MAFFMGSVQKSNLRILISRTDKIGDVVLTLPMAGMLKAHMPRATILFLGQSYTKSVIESSTFVDEFLDWKIIEAMPHNDKLSFLKSLNVDCIIHVFPNIEIAKLAFQAGIEIRIGVMQRIYHFLFCNKLVYLERRRSVKHESQLNLELLSPLLKGIKIPLTDVASFYGMQAKATLSPEVRGLISKTHFNLILHPKSAGSAREWPLQNYKKLIEILPKDRFRVFVTGGPAEVDLLKDFCNLVEGVFLLAGKLPLDEFIEFVNSCDGLIAASTGPIHLAAAFGKYALGIYPPIEPMHAARWGPVGKKASSISALRKCSGCRHSNCCPCMNKVLPEFVLQRIEKWKPEVMKSGLP